MKTLKDLLIPVVGAFSPIYVGNFAFIKVGENVLKVSYYNTFSSGQYDSIKLKLLHKEKEVDTVIIKFIDCFNSITDLTHLNKIGKHIWRDRNGFEWYGKPLKEDLLALTDEIENYIDVIKLLNQQKKG